MVPVLILLGAAIGAYGLPTPPFDLQCDHNLVGLDTDQLNTLSSRHHYATENRRPLLSWSIAHTERGATQTAFRILVSYDISFETTVWDSGLVKDDRGHELKYSGPPLEGGSVYLWRVTWWDHNRESSTSEEIGHFLAVTLTPDDWNMAKWITPSAADVMDTAPTFIKQVSIINKHIATATLYVSGLGFFRAWYNGKDLHSRAEPPIYLAPGWTNYEIRVPYMVFDVTSLTNSSRVFLKVSLGEGWRNTTQFPSHDKLPATDNSPYILRLILMLVFKDLSSDRMVIYSDKTWSIQTSQIQANSIYNGEVYDATITPKVVGNATETEGPAGIMYLPAIPYIAETGIVDHVKNITLDPESVNDHYKQVVDFGNNTAGIVRIKVADVLNGQVVQLVHAEILTHPPYGKRDGSLYFDNLRSADQLDYYTSSGKETFYQPSFTYHGFRYVLVINYPRKLLPNDLYKIRVNTQLKSNSAFHSSIDLLNNIQENVIRGHLSNLMSVPTDCDQRDERLGWMGDAGLSSDAMVINFHMESFFPHRTLLMKDEQIGGNLPDVVPFYRGGGRPSDPSWGAAYPQTVWVLWKYYGDINTAQTYYHSLLDYIEFVESQVPIDGIGNLVGRYGDWVPPPPNKKIDNTFPSAFSFMQNIQQMSEVADALGDSANSTRLKTMFAKHASEFNKAFYSNYQYMDDLQISYALPLALGIVPPEDKDKVVVNFIHRITGLDRSHVTSGIVGVKALLPVLTDLMQHDLAMTLVNQIDYPSWGYMIYNTDEPATAIWELWNANTAGPDMNSRNHHMFSSVSSWMQIDMVGLKQQEGTYGYTALDLYLAQSLDLSSASIELQHPKSIKYSWQRQGGLQCGKAAEDQSSLNPTLPNYGGLSITCGEGTITKVVFASFGNPEGSCGYQRYGNCHSPDSLKIVEELCLNKTQCTIPTGATNWRNTSCPGIMKWLSVALLCHLTSSDLTNGYSSLKVNVSIPIGSQANLNLPTYGMNDLTIWDQNGLIYTNQHLQEDIQGIISAQWNTNGNLLILALLSGDYQLLIRGSRPEETNSLIATHSATLECSNSNQIITNIDWVSYGNPLVGNHGNYTLGTCHSGASRYIAETSCLGKRKCTIALKDAFGNVPCTDVDEWWLAVKYSCNTHT